MAPDGQPELTIPPPAIQAALSGLLLSTEPGAEVSTAGLEVAQALVAGAPTPEHLAAIVRHPYPLDTPNAWMFGGHAGREWAEQVLSLGGSPTPLPTPVTAAAPKAPDLATMSRKLRTIDARFRDAVAQVLALSMRQALRRAEVKVKVRVKGRKAAAIALASVTAEQDRRRYTPAVLAAIGVTTEELLHDSFADAADQVAGLFDRRQRDRRRTLAATFPDVTEQDLEDRWDPAETARRAGIAALVLAGMYALASDRLAQGAGTPTALLEPVGEIPRDPEIPTVLVRQVIQTADGIRPPATGDQPLPALGGGERPTTFDYTDQLVDDLVGMMVPGAGVVYTWTTGDPARPFEPHHLLEGFEATNDTYFVVFAKDPGEWPEGNTYWLPQDHEGCECDLDIDYVDVGQTAALTRSNHVTAPIEHVTAAVRRTATYTIDGQAPDGAMVALIPDHPDLLTVPGGDPAAALHVTLKYLGHAVDWPAEDRTPIDQMLDTVTAGLEPFTARITSIGPLGQDGAVVAFLQVPGLPDVRAQVSTQVDVLAQLAGLDTTDTYPTFRPHLSLGYGLDPTEPAYQALVGLEFACSTIRMAWATDLIDYTLEPATADLGPDAVTAA